MGKRLLRGQRTSSPPLEQGPCPWRCPKVRVSVCHGEFPFCGLPRLAVHVLSQAARSFYGQHRPVWRPHPTGVPASASPTLHLTPMCVPTAPSLCTSTGARPLAEHAPLPAPVLGSQRAWRARWGGCGPHRTGWRRRRRRWWVVWWEQGRGAGPATAAVTGDRPRWPTARDPQAGPVSPSARGVRHCGSRRLLLRGRARRRCYVM